MLIQLHQRRLLPPLPSFNLATAPLHPVWTTTVTPTQRPPSQLPGHAELVQSQSTSQHPFPRHCHCRIQHYLLQTVLPPTMTRRPPHGSSADSSWPTPVLLLMVPLTLEMASRPGRSHTSV